MNIGETELKAIDAAVFLQRAKLGPEDRFDLRQELAIKLLAAKIAPDKTLQGWLNFAAHNWTVDLLRERERYARALRDAPTAPPYFREPWLWEPTWYAPHPKAGQFDPFACHGARVMHCQNDRFGRSRG